MEGNLHRKELSEFEMDDCRRTACGANLVGPDGMAVNEPKAHWNSKSAPKVRMPRPGGRARAPGFAGGGDNAIRQMLGESGVSFGQLFDLSPNALVLLREADSSVALANAAARLMFGADGLASLGHEHFGLSAGVPARLKNASGNAFWAQISVNKVVFRGDACVLASVVDVTERVAEVERANQELESFAYSVGHDLRAPVRSVLGFGRLVLEDHGAQLAPDALANLRRVMDAGARMGQMIEALQELSRIPRTADRTRSVDIAVLARELGRDLAAAEPGRPVEFIVPDSLPALGERSLLRIALQHLLCNAWKFTSGVRAARIEVGAAQSEHGRAFFVRDNGAGFDMTYADKLFKVFQRLHSPREFAGAGVGLATVRRIVDCHNGRIWADSAPGLGATFFLTLPIPR
jgi:signal transduction histidine kinase